MLVSVLGRDEAHLVGLDRSVPTSSIDAARSQKRKCDFRDRAEATLQPLTGGTDHLAPGVERARLLARRVAGCMPQRVDAAIEELIARGTSISVRDLAEIARQQPPGLATAGGTTPKYAAGAAAPLPGAQGGAARADVHPPLAPPVSATDEVRLLGDLGHELFQVALLRACQRPLPQGQLDRLRARL